MAPERLDASIPCRRYKPVDCCCRIAQRKGPPVGGISRLDPLQNAERIEEERTFRILIRWLRIAQYGRTA